MHGPRNPLSRLATLRDQLDRASVSIVLNIAEGAGHFSPSDNARPEARALIVRIVQMLARLGARMATRHLSHDQP